MRKKKTKVRKSKYSDHEISVTLSDYMHLNTRTCMIDSKIADIIIYLNSVGFKTTNCCSGHLVYDTYKKVYDKGSDLYIQINYTKSYCKEELLKFILDLPEGFYANIYKNEYMFDLVHKSIEAGDMMINIRSYNLANALRKYKFAKVSRDERNRLRSYINEVYEADLKMEEIK